MARRRRRSRDPKLEWLAEHPWWGELSDDDLARIASLGERRDHQEGRLLMSAGERGHEAALIIDGEVLVTRGGGHVWLGAGDIVGELALLDGAPRTADVRAASDVQLLILSEEGLRVALGEIAPLRERVLELASRHRRVPGRPPVDQ
jgi:CRP/FNR family transcriptional regulator, cyclic AMP receptor protein